MRLGVDGIAGANSSGGASSGGIAAGHDGVGAASAEAMPAAAGVPAANLHTPLRLTPLLLLCPRFFDFLVPPDYPGATGSAPLPKPEFSGPVVMDEAGAATAVLLRDVHCALFRAYQVMPIARNSAVCAGRQAAHTLLRHADCVSAGQAAGGGCAGQAAGSAADARQPWPRHLDDPLWHGTLLCACRLDRGHPQGMVMIVVVLMLITRCLRACCR